MWTKVKTNWGPIILSLTKSRNVLMLSPKFKLYSSY